MLAAAREVMAEALEAGRHLVRRALRQRQRRERLLRPVAATSTAATASRAAAAARRSVREPFMNRSSYRCPRCQPRPRAGALVVDLRCPPCGSEPGSARRWCRSRCWPAAPGRILRLGSRRRGWPPRSRSCDGTRCSSGSRSARDQPVARAGHHRVDRPAGCPATAAPGSRSRTSRSPRGSSVNLPTPYGEVHCAADGTASVGRPSVVVRVHSESDPTSRREVLRPADPDGPAAAGGRGHLPERSGCCARWTLSFGPDWRLVGSGRDRYLRGRWMPGSRSTSRGT